MPAVNSRMPTPRLAIASCALGMLTYVGIRSFAFDTGATTRQTLREGPQQVSGAAASNPAAAGPLLGSQDVGAAGSVR